MNNRYKNLSIIGIILMFASALVAFSKGDKEYNVLRGTLRVDSLDNDDEINTCVTNDNGGVPECHVTADSLTTRTGQKNSLDKQGRQTCNNTTHNDKE